MNTKELAVKILDTLSEEKLREFIGLFADEGTVARMETEDILAHPENYKTYNSVAEMFSETLSDI